MRVCFTSITDPAAEFHLFNSKNKDIYRLFKENIVGGPSIIFNRYHESGKTFIRNNRNKPCQKIIGYDANANLSLGRRTRVSCWLRITLIRRQEKFFVCEFPQFSGGCRDWIDWLIHDRGIEIQSAFHGGEKKLVLIKSMVSVQSSTQSSNFMVTTGIVIQTSFLMKTLCTQLSKIKTITP